MRRKHTHRPWRTSTQGGALLPGVGSRSLQKRVTDRVCLLKNALCVPTPSPWSTCRRTGAWLCQGGTACKQRLESRHTPQKHTLQLIKEDEVLKHMLQLIKEDESNERACKMSRGPTGVPFCRYVASRVTAPCKGTLVAIMSTHCIHTPEHPAGTAQISRQTGKPGTATGSRHAHSCQAASVGAQSRGV